MPSSKTPNSSPGSIASMLNGNPISLFQFPRDRVVAPFRASTSAIISLTVVLPTLPVTATIFAFSASRYPRAMSPKALSVSRTQSSGAEGG